MMIIVELYSLDLRLILRLTIPIHWLPLHIMNGRRGLTAYMFQAIYSSIYVELPLWNQEERLSQHKNSRPPQQEVIYSTYKEINVLLHFFIADLPSVNTVIQSSLTTMNPKYTRVSTLNQAYFYDTFEIRATASGFYTFESNSTIDTFGSLYSGYFWPNHPEWNLLISDDDTDGYRHFLFQQNLEWNRKYILVVTTAREQIIGPYEVRITGVAPVEYQLTTFTETSTMSYITTEGSKSCT